MFIVSIEDEVMKRKKHCATKRHERIARAIFKDLVAVFVAGSGKGVQLVNRRLKRPVRCTELMAISLQDCQFMYSVYCAITCRRQDGQEYIRSKAYNFTQPYRQSFLSEWLNSEHIELMKTTNEMHRCTAAWIACPNGVEISDSEASDIFTNLGAYNFLAKWEADK